MSYHIVFAWFPLLVFLSFLVIMKKMIVSKKTDDRLPPGPRKLPFLGNLHQVGALPHRALWQLSKRYGPVMFLRFGNVPTVIISSANTANEVLKLRDLDCCSRPQSGSAIRRFSYNFMDISFSPYGDRWRENRKICVIELLSAKRVQSFRFVREEEIASVISSINESSLRSTHVDLSQTFCSLTAGIIFRVVFGKKFQGSEFDDDRFHDYILDAMRLLGNFNVSDYFPYNLGRVINRFSGFHQKLERSFRDLDVFIQNNIDQHIDRENKIREEEHEDLIDILLKFERDQNTIKAILMDMFFAGVDTSAVTLIWAMTELVKNPRIMKKAQDEVRSCFGNEGKVTENNIDKLQYVKMIVKETLRLHPPVPFLLPREAMTRFKINGYDVYPKTQLQVNVWAIGRDPTYWNDPDEFYPERFMDNDVDYKGQHFEFLPFGAGRRSCPGINMGVSTVELGLANVLYFFDWKLPDGTKESDIDMEEVSGLALHKKTVLKLVPVRI